MVGVKLVNALTMRAKPQAPGPATCQNSRRSLALLAAVLFQRCWRCIASGKALRVLLQAGMLLPIHAQAAGLSDQALSERLNAAAALGSSLTPFGAERSGAETTGVNSADWQQLPPWRGGLSFPPADFNGHLINPYRAETPLALLTASSPESQLQWLGTGLRLWLQHHPQQAIRVYASHRTATAPFRILDQAYRNRVRLEPSPQGGFLYGHGAIPYPQPERGEQIIWNHLLAWRGTQDDYGLLERQRQNGEASVPWLWQVSEQWPWQQDVEHCGHACEGEQGHYSARLQPLMQRQWQLVQPPQGAPLIWKQQLYMQAGRPILDASIAGSWPVGDQTRMLGSAEVGLYSELPRDYLWSLLGKRMLLVPYNQYPSQDVVETMQGGEGVMDWQQLRFELHRVWVVDGVLRKNADNQYRKRVYYVDEDSWQIVMADLYGHDGSLQRVGLQFLYSDYRIPAMRTALQGILNVRNDDASWLLRTSW